MLQSQAQKFIHIPTPGDHYSPATGSAVMTVIYHITQCHAAHGGETVLIVNRGTRHDYSPGECVEVEGPPYPSKWQKGIDLGLGRLGLPRIFGRSVFRPHLRAIPADFSGPVFIHNDPAAIALARRLRPKATICLWAHNELFRTYSNHEVRKVAEAADHMICCSHYIANLLRQRLHSSFREKVHAVRNGVDVEEFAPAIPPPENRLPVILFVGRVQPVKGPDLLIRAAVKLAEEGLQFKLQIVGSQGFSAADPLTPYEQRLRELAAPISDRVDFRPFVSRKEVPNLYRSADIYVVPSNWDDPCPLTVSEGLASGLPCVVSRRGGIPEIAENAALYFDPPDINQLAAHLKGLLTDPQARRDWREKARRRAMEITWRRSYQQLLEAFN